MQMKDVKIANICVYAYRFLALLLLFVLLMTAVYAIPEDKIAYRQDISKFILAQEGDWWWFGNLFATEAGRLDNTTDTLMMDEALVADKELSAFEAAMSVNGYSRYWHGYMVVLRPLLMLYDYWQIRYLLMFTFFLLFVMAFRQIDRKLGLVPAIAFALSIVACHIVTLAVSMQYVSVFLIVFISIILLLETGKQKARRWSLFFMTVGMITSFVDLLTVPLLTLGFPLLVWIQMDIRTDAEQPLLNRLWRVFLLSAAWTMGFSLCWAAKWVIGSIALKENVILDAIQSIFFRTGGGSSEGRLDTVFINFKMFFLSNGLRGAWPLALPTAMLFLSALFFGKQKRFKGAAFLPVAMYPYLWYVVLNNHSSVHFWFVYRLQALTLFGLLLALGEAIDFDRLNVILSRIRKNRAAS